MKHNANDLFDRYFLVRMNYLNSRSVDQLRRFGQRVSGVAEIDRNLDKQEIVTELTVNAMFEKFRSGVTIKLVRYSDAAEVYRIIHAHLIKWAEYITTGINVGNAPLSDLVELDRFASVVYDKAVNVFSEQERTSALAGTFQRVQSINFNNILTRARKSEYHSVETTANGVEVMRVKELDTPKIIERTSFKDLFSSRISEVKGWRGSDE
jgi:phage-related protein